MIWILGGIAWLGVGVFGYLLTRSGYRAGLGRWPASARNVTILVGLLLPPVVFISGLFIYIDGHDVDGNSSW